MKDPKQSLLLKNDKAEDTLVKKLTGLSLGTEGYDEIDQVEPTDDSAKAVVEPASSILSMLNKDQTDKPLIIETLLDFKITTDYKSLFSSIETPTLIDLIAKQKPALPINTLISKMYTFQSKSNSFFKESTSFFKSQYHTHPSSSSTPPRKTKPATRSLLVMTEVVWGTLGDYYAAFKLIKAIKTAHPDLKVTWLMRAKDQVLPDVASAADKVYVLQEWREFFSPEKKALQDAMETAATVLQFPSFHFLKADLSRRINDIYRADKTPMIQCLEYDYRGKPGTVTTRSISAGLGENCLGIFIDEKSPLTKDQHINTLSEPLRSQLTEGKSAKDYIATHDVFFGYRNKNETQACNSVSIPSFVEIILKLIQLGGIKKDHIDIIAPFNDSESANIMMNTIMLKEAGISIVCIQNKEGETQQIKVCDKGKILRLINPFRLNQADMKALLHIAHPFMLCTGDQSLSEVISFSGLPYYQVMQWKTGVISALLLLTQKVCGIDSELCQFLLLSSSYISMTTTQIAEILLSPKIYEEMRTLRDYISQHKNLYTELPKYLITEIDRELSNASDVLEEEKEQAVRKQMAAC